MNEHNVDRLMQQLAAEPTPERRDPWPAIRARITRREPPRSAGIRAVPRLAWGAAAAAVVVVAISGASLLAAARPQSATAAEILDRMQLEAQGGVMATSESSGACEPIMNPTDLTDRVGQLLGVSGERVRQAMRIQTFRVAPPPGAPAGALPAAGSDTFQIPVPPPSGGGLPAQGNVLYGVGEAVQQPGPLPDPMARLAERLGVSRERVQQAFADPSCPERIMIRFPGSVDDPQYQRAAQQLGVTPRQLVDAVRATAPMPPPGGEGAPVSPDQMIQRIASELGVTPDQLRSALQQAAGGR